MEGINRIGAKSKLEGDSDDDGAIVRVQGQYLVSSV